VQRRVSVRAQMRRVVAKPWLLRRVVRRKGKINPDLMRLVN
jgi:hypothetical protein